MQYQSPMPRKKTEEVTAVETKIDETGSAVEQAVEKPKRTRRKKAETAEEAAAEPVVEEVPAEEAPKKQYGLPEDYSRQSAPAPAKEAKAAVHRQEQSEFSKKLGHAKLVLKKKIAEQQDARRAAKAAEAERQRILAREEEARKAERARPR